MALVGVLALGGVIIAAPSPAQAFCDTSISPDCPGNAANLPILIEAGVMSAPTALSGAAGTTIAVATGGVAGLGTFNTAIGIVGASTAVVAGGAIATGLLTQTGMPTGVKLKTTPGSGATAGNSCPVFTAPTVVPASCSGISDLFGAGPLAVTALSVIQTGRAYTVSGHVAGTGPVGQDGTVFVAYADGSQCSIFNHLGFAQNAPVDTDFSVDNTLNPCSTAQETGQARVVVWETRGLGGGRPYWYDVALQSWAAGTVAAGGWHGLIRTTVTCTGPDGDNPQTASQPVDVASGSDLVVPSVQCPSGTLATAVAIEFQQTGTSDWLPLTQGSAPGSVKSLVTTYPDCFGPGVAPCSMQLQLLGGQGQWETCGKLAEFCPDWVRQQQTSPAMFRCQYGSYTLDINSCSAFRRPGSLLPNQEPDGTPKPTTAPVPGPSELPNPVINPDTGEQLPPAEALDPGTGDQADQNASDCWPTGWGVFNPLAWIYQPIVCAAQYLFVPKQSTITEIQTRIQTRFDESPPGEMARTMRMPLLPVIDAGGCSGFTISLAWMKQGAFVDAPFPASFQLLQACDGDVLHPWAVFASLVIGAGAIAVCFKTWPTLIGRVFGYGGIE